MERQTLAVDRRTLLGENRNHPRVADIREGVGSHLRRAAPPVAHLEAFRQAGHHTGTVRRAVAHLAVHTRTGRVEPHKSAVALRRTVVPVVGAYRKAVRAAAPAVVHSRVAPPLEDNPLEDNRLDCLDPEEERHLS